MQTQRMDHLEQENHKLREEVTTLQVENEILRNLVSLMTVAQGQPLSLPIVSTHAQTVASTSPISTVFASTQHAMLEGYLWSTPLSSGGLFRLGVPKFQAPFVQQTKPIPQLAPLFSQAAMTYSSPLTHITKQDHGPNYHSESMVTYDQVDELKKKLDGL